jgi:WD40 repeat protein
MGSSLAVSATGLAATYTDDRTLRLWDIASRTLLRSVNGTALDGIVHPVRPAWDSRANEVLLSKHDSAIAVGTSQAPRPVALDNGGELVAVPGRDPRYLVKRNGRWSLVNDTGTLTYALTGLEPLGNDVAVSADGRTALFRSRGGLIRWPLNTDRGVEIPLPEIGEHVAELGFRAPLALSSDGDAGFVCLDGSGPTRLLIVQGLGNVPRSRTIALEGAGCRVGAAGDAVVVASGDSVVGFNARSGAVNWKVPRAQTVTSLAVTPDGRSVVLVGFSGDVEALDVASGVSLGPLGARISPPEEVWFARDRLITLRRSRRGFDHRQRIASWSFGDGQLRKAGSVDWGYARQVDANGILQCAHDSQPGCGLEQRGVVFRSSPLGEDWLGEKPDASSAHAAAPALLCVPKKTRTFSAHSPTRTVLLETAATAGHSKYALYTHEGGAYALVDVPPKGLLRDAFWFSTEGRWVFGAPPVRGMLSELRVWDARSGKRVGTFTAGPADRAGIEIGPKARPRRGYFAEAVSDDGRYLAVVSGDSATTYELPSGRALRTLRVTGASWLTAAAFANRSSSQLFIGTAHGELLATDRGGTIIAARATSNGGEIVAFVVSNQAGRVATRSDDGPVRIWQSELLTELAALVEFEDGESIAVTPAGAYAGATEAASAVRFVYSDPEEGFSFEQFAASFARPDIVAKRLATGEGDAARAMTRPPRLELVSRSRRESAVRVTARVSSSIRVRRIAAFVEGREVATLEIAASAAEFDMGIPPSVSGSATLVAFDDAGSASNPLRIADTVRVSGRSNLWIVAVGVGQYPLLPEHRQLPAATADARDIGNGPGSSGRPGSGVCGSTPGGVGCLGAIAKQPFPSRLHTCPRTRSERLQGILLRRRR